MGNNQSKLKKEDLDSKTESTQEIGSEFDLNV